jgi:uncharacterized protein (TIGR04255 family)
VSSPPYINDSLRWVAADIRISASSALATAVPSELREHLRDDFELLEPVPALSVNIAVAGAAATPVAPQQVMLNRLIRRDRLVSLTLGRDSITLETTSYQGWTAFRGLLEAALRHIEQDSRPDGILRIGLRYIDEIRLPQSPATVGGWAGWIDEHLLSAFALDQHDEPTQGTIILQYGTAPGYVTVLRASAVPTGRVVQPEGHLRVPSGTPTDAFFLLDTDASWTDPDSQVPEFQSEFTLNVFDDLHARCHRLYEEAIEEQLREQVLRRPRGEVWGDET